MTSAFWPLAALAFVGTIGPATPGMARQAGSGLAPGAVAGAGSGLAPGAGGIAPMTPALPATAPPVASIRPGDALGFPGVGTMGTTSNGVPYTNPPLVPAYRIRRPTRPVPNPPH